MPGEAQPRSSRLCPVELEHPHLKEERRLPLAPLLGPDAPLLCARPGLTLGPRSPVHEKAMDADAAPAPPVGPPRPVRALPHCIASWSLLRSTRLDVVIRHNPVASPDLLLCSSICSFVRSSRCLLRSEPVHLRSRIFGSSPGSGLSGWTAFRRNPGTR